jgi:hypothetical protein
MLPQILKRIAIGVGLATLVVIAVGFALPRTYTVTRSVTIDADPARIHGFVGDLERWPDWTTWIQEDPTIEIAYGDNTTGVGAHQSWKGKSGSGELTFTRSDPATGIAYDMGFDGGKYVARCEMNYRPVGDRTEVEWTMTGDHGLNVLERYMGLMMDAVIGPMFEDGLDRLKVAAERPSAPSPSDPESAG